MRFQRRSQTLITIGMAGALLAGASDGCLADDGKSAKPLALRMIMQEMGKNMQIDQFPVAAGDPVGNGCYGCHNTFHKPFIAHFYGKKDAP